MSHQVSEVAAARLQDGADWRIGLASSSGFLQAGGGIRACNSLLLWLLKGLPQHCGSQLTGSGNLLLL